MKGGRMSWEGDKRRDLVRETSRLQKEKERERRKKALKALKGFGKENRRKDQRRKSRVCFAGAVRGVRLIIY